MAGITTTQFDDSPLGFGTKGALIGAIRLNRSLSWNRVGNMLRLFGVNETERKTKKEISGVRLRNPAVTVFLVIVSSILVACTQEDSTGQVLYEMHCAQCHGAGGQGEGELAYLMYPRPADLTAGVFKLRSTPPGTPPSDEDLLRTLKRGIPASAMPGFHFLGDEKLYALVRHMKSLSGQSDQQKSAQTIEVGLAPPKTDAAIESGGKLFEKLGCTNCHGPAGKGAGPAAASLQDYRGMPLLIPDFTVGNFKGGGDAKDLYLRITTGIEGTPMVSYANVATDEQRWQLAYYVQSLRDPSNKQLAGLNPENSVISCHRESDLPSEGLGPLSDLWDRREGYRIPLHPVGLERSIYNMRVRCSYGEERLALLIEWRDSTPSKGTDGANYFNYFKDGAAVQFGLSKSVGFIGMGDQNHPTNIWYWKASRQVAAGQDGDHGPYLDHEPMADDPAWPAAAGADNVFAVLDSSIEDANAVGIGSLQSQPMSQQNVAGEGARVGDHWRVLMIRDLQSPDPEDVQLRADAMHPVAFAVWEGSQQQRDGQKSVSAWYRLKLN